MPSSTMTTPSSAPVRPDRVLSLSKGLTPNDPTEH